MFKEEAAQRRNKIAQKLDEGEMLIAFGGNDELGITDVPDREKADKNFMYLVGSDIPEGLLLMARVRGNVQEYLFIKRGSENDAFYLGMSPDPEYYMGLTGIATVLYMDDFNDIIENLNRFTKLRRVCFSSSFEKPSKYPRFETFMAKRLKEAYPGIQIDSLTHEINNMRAVKSSLEIEQIRTAIDITGEAIAVGAKQLRAGLCDYQMASIIEHEMKMRGGDVYIVQALLGKQTCIMHNFHSDAIAKDGDLFLVDTGCFYNDYCSDISRTFPVCGKFSDEQSYWYNVCLTTQEMVIESLAPGKLAADCGKEGNAFLEGELRKHRYLEDGQSVRSLIGHFNKNYATPGMINHGIGLNYHEEKCDDTGILKPGMVFTIEPGIYLGEKNLGLRIEDNVLITETGYEVLSSGIPKTLEDIRNMMI